MVDAAVVALVVAGLLRAISRHSHTFTQT
eukprot:COSAG01_NODE_33347_length_565_cov_3.706009_1_plen_28_part_01